MDSLTFQKYVSNSYKNKSRYWGSISFETGLFSSVIALIFPAGISHIVVDDSKVGGTRQAFQSLEIAFFY